MSSREFLRPRLLGSRFEGATIPLDVLADLAVLGEMVIEVAKWRYLESHPERQRSPKGFTKGISLKLVGVEDGSAVPAINLEFSEGTRSDVSPRLPGMPEQNETYFFEARDAIIDSVSVASNGIAHDYALLPKHLAYFDRLGRGLQDGEALELRDPAGTKRATLNRESRRRLVEASQIRETSEEVVIRGSIPEADQDRMTFELQSYVGKIPGRIPDEHFDVVLEAFNQYRTSGNVSIQGVVKYDRGGRPLRIEAVEDVVLLDPLDVPSQLDEFRTMVDGWLDGEGRAPAPELIEWLEDSFDSFYPDDAELPYLYPTTEGGVQAEWTLGAHEVSLRFHPHDHTGEWHDLALDTDEEETRELDLTQRGEWEWLAARLATLSRAA